MSHTSYSSVERPSKNASSKRCAIVSVGMRAARMAYPKRLVTPSVNFSSAVLAGESSHNHSNNVMHMAHGCNLTSGESMQD